MLSPKNINVLKAETQVRVLLEDNSISQETLVLLKIYFQQSQLIN